MKNNTIMNSSFWEQDNNGVFVIAEAGLNHGGSFDMAARMIEEAAKAGADAVKFQNFETEDFIFDRSLEYTYQSQGKEVTEPMWDLCKRCEIKDEWLPRFKNLCVDLGISFLSTPTSNTGVDKLVNVGVDFLKNGSDYLSHLQLLRYMGSTNIPVIISTGMAYEEEIREAIEAVHSGGNSAVILLHCTSTYPTQTSDVNLRRMTSLKKTFNLPIGFSDHTIGSAAAIQAVSLGACVIERHFTLDHNMVGPDHWFSSTPSELKQYINAIREAEMRLGLENIEPAEGEMTNRENFRLSLVAVRDIFKGQVLTQEDFAVAKPGSGLPPKESEKLIGRKTTKDIKRGSLLKWEHFE